MATTVNVLCYKSKTLSNGEYFVILSTAKNLKAPTLYLQILHTPSLLSRLSGGAVFRMTEQKESINGVLGQPPPFSL